jgi:hypothetical protein
VVASTGSGGVNTKPIAPNTNDVNNDTADFAFRRANKP